MKVGLSFSRCVRDIVEHRVDINNVLVVISRTDFDPHDDQQWGGIWAGYCRGSGFSRAEWDNYDFFNKEHENKFRDVSCELWKQGKLHQPRKFGAHPSRRGEFWLETVLPDEELQSRPAVKDAWDQFQMLAGLTSVKLDREYK